MAASPRLGAHGNDDRRPGEERVRARPRGHGLGRFAFARSDLDGLDALKLLAIARGVSIGAAPTPIHMLTW
jgi:hypothetical protein